MFAEWRQLIRRGFNHYGSRILKTADAADSSAGAEAAIATGDKPWALLPAGEDGVTGLSKECQNLHVDNEPLDTALDPGRDSALFTISVDGTIQAWTDGMRGRCEYQEGDVVGKHISIFYSEEDRRDRVPESDLYSAAVSGCVIGKGLRPHKNDALLTADILIVALHDNMGFLSGFAGVMRDPKTTAGSQANATDGRFDIGELERTARQLHHENESMRSTLEAFGEGIISTDAGGLITSLNAVAEQLTGWSIDEAAGLHAEAVFQLVNEASWDPVHNPVLRALEERRLVELDDSCILVSSGGNRRVIEGSCAPVHAQNLQITGTILVFRDITDARQRALELQYQAQHDALTGLVNRAEFERRVSRVLQTSTTRESHVLFYLDLDRFKAVNDNCGHVAGDELLRQVAAVVESKVRHRDTLARLGGDEFGVLLEHCDLHQAARVAESIRDAIREHPFVWCERAFSIDVSIGIVGIAGGTWTLAEVVNAADSACYTAKHTDRNHIHIHDPSLSRNDDTCEAQHWCQLIRHALTEDHFQLYVQPIAPIAESELHTLRGEILLRLHGDDGQIITPDHFIAAAERNNQMIEIDQWVLRKLFALLKSCPHLSPGQIRLSVNISGHALGSKEFLSFIEDILTESPLPAHCLCFEIAEETAISNMRAVRRLVEALRRQQCHFALDRFGAALTSIEYLRNFPIDYLKIDGRFIRDVVDDPVHQTIVESTQRIGHLLGIKTIAVAADTAAAVARLREIGLDFAQGFAIAQPRPLEEALAEFRLADAA